MKLITFLIISILFIEFSFLKKIKRSKSSTNLMTKSKKDVFYTYPSTVYASTSRFPISNYSINRGPSYTYVNPSDLVTPLTTGTFSRGGVLYQTNAPSIPYGTGYSYGPWQKIKMK